jgi:hypothetical protein
MCGVSLSTRFLLMLCVFAGLATGLVHSYSHGAEDECASHCGSEHEKKTQTDHDDQEKVPHHHTCCHFPSADRTMDAAFLPVSFRAILVEIDTDESLIPEEPVFSLDKPPLI